ncbi:MAG: hypothetical protein ACE5I7_16100, partial [Candidatus Binatia bacterium]
MRIVLKVLLVLLVFTYGTMRGVAPAFGDTLGTGTGLTGVNQLSRVGGLPFPLPPGLPFLPPSAGTGAIFDDVTFNVLGTPVNMVSLGAATVISARTGGVVDFTPDPPPSLGGGGSKKTDCVSEWSVGLN